MDIVKFLVDNDADKMQIGGPMYEASVRNDLRNAAGDSGRDFQESNTTRARVAWYYLVGGLTQQDIA